MDLRTHTGSSSGRTLLLVGYRTQDRRSKELLVISQRLFGMWADLDLQVTLQLPLVKLFRLCIATSSVLHT